MSEWIFAKVNVATKQANDLRWTIIHIVQNKFPNKLVWYN